MGSRCGPGCHAIGIYYIYLNINSKGYSNLP